MSGPDSSIDWSIQHKSEGWGFMSPSGRDIFCLKNVDTFTRTPVSVSKMNAVARAQLTFQSLTFLQLYIYICICMYVCIFTHRQACTHMGALT